MRQRIESLEQSNIKIRLSVLASAFISTKVFHSSVYFHLIVLTFFDIIH